MTGIDRDKLRAAIRRLDNETIYYMLNEAIALLPDAQLERVAARHMDVKRLRPDETRHSGGLLADVKEFEKASRRGDYYESFQVSSKNFMEKSKGTRAWIFECNRRLGLCVSLAKEGDAAEVCEAFEILFGLLRRIDEGHDDVLFFADEAGSWQVGVDWQKVLPAWFASLSATVEPDEYAQRVVATVDEFENYKREDHLATAKRMATLAQRQALEVQSTKTGRP